MAKKIIRHRLVTWFEEFEDKFAPGGVNLREHISHFGDDVEIPDDEVERIESVNTKQDPPFFSDEDAKAIRDGNYRGRHAALLEQFRSGVIPNRQGQGQVEPADGEGFDVSGLSAEELGEYINENKLTVDQTVALANEGDTDSIEKVWDAENHAAQLRGNDPRKGVTDRLDSMLNAATSGQ